MTAFALDLRLTFTKYSVQTESKLLPTNALILFIVGRAIRKPAGWFHKVYPILLIHWPTTAPLLIECFNDSFSCDQNVFRLALSLSLSSFEFFSLFWIP